MSSIKLHSKYGVNPTILLCPVCGKETSEIALLGSSCKEKAPMFTQSNVPCPECLLLMESGCFIMEVSDLSTPSYVEKTGRYLCLKKEAYQRVFGEECPKMAFIKKSEFEVLFRDIIFEDCSPLNKEEVRED